MATQEDIAVLREQRHQAIAGCEFTKAKLIDLQLKRLADQQFGDDSSQRRLRGQLEYDKVKERVRSEAQQAHAAAVDELFQVEAEWQTRLTALQSEQAKKLQVHAESFAAELELSATRAVPDSLALRKEAQAVAKLGDFDTAEALFAEANATQQTTILERQAEIREVYDRLIAQVEGKHAEELNLHNEKRLLKLRDVRAKYAAKVEKLKKQLAHSAFRFSVTRNERDEAEMFEDLTDPEDTLSPSRSRPASRSGSSSPGSSPRNRALRRSGGSLPGSPTSPKVPPRLAKSSPAPVET
jgi:hypothetical protein